VWDPTIKLTSFSDKYQQKGKYPKLTCVITNNNHNRTKITEPPRMSKCEVEIGEDLVDGGKEPNDIEKKIDRNKGSCRDNLEQWKSDLLKDEPP
jgi:hypothetical protein